MELSLAVVYVVSVESSSMASSSTLNLIGSVPLALDGS
jgi:hypothetical protein